MELRPTPRDVSPSFVFGGLNNRDSVVSLTKVHSDTTTQQTAPEASAKSLLRSIKRNDDELSSQNNRKTLVADFSNEEQALLEKGIMIGVDPTLRRTRSQAFTLSDLDNEESHDQSSLEFADLQAQESIMSLHALMQLPAEHNGSPDSGYGNLLENEYKLSNLLTSNRTRTSTEATSSSCGSGRSYGRRSNPSSGVPSSLWSGRESTLELVTEEEVEQENATTRTQSCTGSDEEMEPQLPPTQTRPEIRVGEKVASNARVPSQFYHPDEDIILPVIHRKGIIRASSMEEHVPVSPSVPITDTPPTTMSSSPVQGRKPSPASRKRNSGGRQRSHSTIKDSTEEKSAFQIQDELSKENYHFSLCESLTAVIEEYKSLLHEQVYDEQDIAQAQSHRDRGSTLLSPTDDDIDYVSSTLRPNSLNELAADAGIGRSPSEKEREDSGTSEDPESSLSSSMTDYNVVTPRKNSNGSRLHRDLLTSSLSSRKVSLLKLMHSPLSSSSAESTAHGLLQYVAQVFGGNSRVEFRMPQVVQLPLDFITSIQKEEQLQYSVTDTSSPIRGDTVWAPPRQQVIHSLYLPALLRDIPERLSQQANRCAGCGMIMNISHHRYFRFCNYTGKYFCVSCHQNTLSSIPAYIIDRWSFKRLAISNFAKETLAAIDREPLFNLESLNPELYNQVSDLSKIRELRRMLTIMRKYIVTCRRAESVSDQFTVNTHWTNGDIDIYSLNDLHSVKNGQMIKQLRILVSESEKHIRNCPLCQGKGYICELCNHDDVIYPFDFIKIYQCSECRACFHKKCHSEHKQCPKCQRKEKYTRQRLNEQSNSLSPTR